jgi:subtilisin family serine protease
MKKSLFAAALCSALALSFGLVTASAQESIPASEAENGNLWFVELSGAPTADGNSLANVRSGKAAFKKAAVQAGVTYTERRSFDVLFNGYSVEIDAANRTKLASIEGVKALWPVERIDAPEAPVAGSTPNLDKAIAMTHADIVQNSLGFTGTGIKVAVMDTGIDYDHADLGGDGVHRTNSDQFPSSRVVEGWDFVGDNFDASNPASPEPSPDPYPDDCNGHGSHVAGIIGASGQITGVAPGVTYGAYRVFGCVGSTTSDIMLAAMERAFNDGANVLNMSIGARAQWPQYPTAAASSLLVKNGMVVVASIGNNGPGGSAADGPWAAGAPGVGGNVIGVAAYDNGQLAIDVNGDLYGYNQATGSPTAPTSGSLPMARTGTTTTANDACNAVAPAPGSLTGQAVLIRRGTCSFFEKATNAQNAGAAAVVLYNNAAGALNPTVAGTPAITIPVVAVTAAHGAAINAEIAAGATTLTWTSTAVTFPQGTGGLISGFSSFGMAADLTLKPDIGAPGGGIVSTIPLNQGGYGVNSGTSMSSPHVAGAAALLLQAKQGMKGKAYAAQNIRDWLQNSANPTPWSGNPALGFLEQTNRQGAGLLDIEAAILATVGVTPGKLSIGESETGPQVRTLTLKNVGTSSVTLDLSHVAALTTGPKNQTNFAAVTAHVSDAAVAFSINSVTVPAGGSTTVNVTFTPATTASAPAHSQYGGYIVLTPQGGGEALSVPYAGFIGDYQTVPVLTPTVNGFPWLAQLAPCVPPPGLCFFNQPGGATYTLVGDDVPQILFHLDHHSQRLEFLVHSTSGQEFYYIADDSYVGRSTTAAGFFVQTWDGNTFKVSGPTIQNLTVPDGTYRVTIRVTKALGSKTNPAHVETWVSPIITIDRP